MSKTKKEKQLDLELEEKVEELEPHQDTPEEIEEFDKETLLRQQDHQPQEQVEEDLPPHVMVEDKPEVKVKKKPNKPVKGKIVDCNALRLREGASIKSKELLVMPVDSQVTVFEDSSTESFYAVEFNGTSGYALKTFIKLGE